MKVARIEHVVSLTKISVRWQYCQTNTVFDKSIKICCYAIWQKAGTEKGNEQSVYIDTSLTFSDHTSQILKRGYSSLKSLYGSKNILSKKNKIIFTEPLVLSHANYAKAVYTPSLRKYDQIRLQKLQNSCIRFITGLKRNEYISHCFKELNWLNTKELASLHAACL
nr:unnamed protein product [Callosobruchus analis]